MEARFLKGITVLLNGNYVPGPLAAWFLYNLGARVIKMEPLTGDMFRHIPPFYKNKKQKGEDKIGASFSALNGGFESIAVNVKSEDGIRIFERLIAKSDVYIDGNRPHFVETITGKTPEMINPDTVYVPLTAFGTNGPLSNLAGHDGNCLSLAGVLSYNGLSKKLLPAMPGIPMVDIMSATLAALSIMAVLYGKINPRSNEKTKCFDFAMLDAAFFLNQINITKFFADRLDPVPDKEWLNGGRGYYKTYRTKDDKAVFFAAIEDKLFRNFAEKIGRKDLMELRRTSEANPEALIKEIEFIFASRTLAEWETLLADCDCCFSPVNSLSDAITNNQIQHRKSIKETTDANLGPLQKISYPGFFDGKKYFSEGSVPLIGEHSHTILQELNFDNEFIEKAFRNKVVA